MTVTHPMYDLQSRSQLGESVGYEGFAIEQVLLVLEKEKGIAHPLELRLEDGKNPTFVLSFCDHIGANMAADLVDEFVPLLYCASFKILDMVLEWCLKENGDSPDGKFYSFREKIVKLQNGFVVDWPDFLAQEPTWPSVLLETYAALRQKRNAIIHRPWGNTNNGELHFDFNYKDDLATSAPYPTIHDTDTVSMEDVLNLCAFTHQLQELLLDTSMQSDVSINELKHKANALSPLHGSPPFQVIEHRLIRANFITQKDIIDFGLAHAGAKQQPGNYVLEVVIERGTRRWFIDAARSTEFTGEVPLAELSQFEVHNG